VFGAKVVGAVVLSTVALAACGSDNSAPTVGTTVPRTTTTEAATTTTARTTTTTVRATTTTARATTTTTARGTTTSASGSTTTADSNRCHTSELQGSLGPPNAGAGNLYVPLVLKNTGTRPCTVAGFPGVSLLDAAGNQIEQPAQREPGFPETAVPLAPGGTASTALHTTNEGIAPGGCWPESAKVKVFPPNELDALVFDGKFKVCGNAFTLRPLVAGSSGT
jgi:hypothetical protein